MQHVVQYVAEHLGHAVRVGRTEPACRVSTSRAICWASYAFRAAAVAESTSVLVSVGIVGDEPTFLRARDGGDVLNESARAK